MAGITNPPGFGGARWGETFWARFHAFSGPPFSVASSTDWLPTISTTVARTINVAAGRAQACGVYEDTDTTEPVAFAANTGGSTRFDYLLATWNWSTNTRVFRALSGTTTAYPDINPSVTTADPAKVNRVPGVQYDAIIAAVQIPAGRGIFQPGDLVSDMRVWGGNAGPMVSNVTPALRPNLHLPIGTQVMVNGLDTYVRMPNGSLQTTNPRLLAVGTGTMTIPFNADTPVPLSNTVIAQGVTYNPSNGRCTFTVSGDYLCTATAAWNATANYRGKRNVSLARNGTPLLYTIDSIFPNDADNAYSNTAMLLHFEAGEYLSMIVAHEAEVVATGANVDLVLDRSRCALSATFQGS